MKQWLPIPISEIEKIDNDRRLTDTPASTLDGFAYAWLKAYRGAPLSQRQLAQWASWSKRKATDVLNAVISCQHDWMDQKRSKNGPPVGTKNEPAQSNDPAQLADSADQDRTRSGPDPIQKRTDRARSYSLQLESQLDPQLHAGTSSGNSSVKSEQEKKTEPQPKAARIAYAPFWDEMEGIRLAHVPNARRIKMGKRQPTIRARIKEHGEQPLIHAWRWFWESSHQRAVWLRDNGCSIDTFLAASKCRQYVAFAAEWNPEQEQHHTGPDLMDLDDSQFDEYGNIIEFQPNRSGTNGNE